MFTPLWVDWMYVQLYCETELIMTEISISKKGVPSDKNLTSLSIMNFNKQGVFDYERLNSECDCSYKIKMGLFYEEFSHPPSGMLSTSRYGDWNWYFIIVMKFQ